MSMITRVHTCKHRLDISQTSNNDVYSKESSKTLRSYDNMCSVRPGTRKLETYSDEKHMLIKPLIRTEKINLP